MSELEVGALYRLTASWRVGIEYELRRNDSSVASYGYSSNSYLLRLRYAY